MRASTEPSGTFFSESRRRRSPFIRLSSPYVYAILVTALATMQGAPFWFDILKKIVNIRGTGPSPAE